MSSLSWELGRTVLYSSEQPFSLATRTGKDTNKLGAADIWSYLLSLSESVTTSTNSDVKKPVKLKHFKGADFKRTWKDAASHIGSGTSYSVEKCTLDTPRANLVAVKKLNIFRPGRAENSRMSSTAVQYSIATILKELRILAHTP